MTDTKFDPNYTSAHDKTYYTFAELYRLNGQELARLTLQTVHRQAIAIANGVVDIVAIRNEKLIEKVLDVQTYEYLESLNWEK